MALLRLLACLATVALATNEAGTAFLEQNAKQEGVITLPSGLQYKKIVAVKRRGPPYGYNPTPKFDTPCEVFIRGSTIDGHVFEDNHKLSTVAPHQLVAGLEEALLLMRQGETWEVAVPSSLGYGEQARTDLIVAGSALIYHIELVKIQVGRRIEPKQDESIFNFHGDDPLARAKETRRKLREKNAKEAAERAKKAAEKAEAAEL